MRKFLNIFWNFIGVKTLVITDIDTTFSPEGKTRYQSCKVADGTNTSNASLKYFLSAPESTDNKFPEWIQKLKDGNLKASDPLIHCCYQQQEKDYHARSFEDAFIHINKEKICQKREKLSGLVNTSCLTKDNLDSYDLTEKNHW